LKESFRYRASRYLVSTQPLSDMQPMEVLMDKFRNTRIGIFVLLCGVLLFISCSSRNRLFDNLPKHTIVVDSSAVRRFAQTVAQKSNNYEEASRDKYFQRIICGKDLAFAFINQNQEQARLLLYTYDFQDSCVLYSNLLQPGVSLLFVETLPIPVGHYFVNDGKYTMPFYRPPEK